MRENKFIAFLGVCGTTLLLSVFFLAMFGVVDLRLVNDTVLSPLLVFSINSSLFMVNMYFTISICLNTDSKKTFKYMLWYIPIYIIPHFITIPSFLTSVVLPFGFVLIINKNKRTIINIITFSTVTIAYQLISGYIKFFGFGFNVYNGNSILALIYAIDLFLFFIIYKRVVNYNGLDCKHLVFPEKKSIQQNAELSKETLDLSDLSRKQKFMFLFLASGYQVFQLLVVLAIGLINNMFVELILILPMFWFGRKILKQSWHSDTLWICSLATFGGFYTLTKVVLPLHISLFSIITLTGLFIYLLHRLGVNDERLQELESRYNSDFTKYGFTKAMSSFAFDYKINKLSIKQQMELSGLSEQVVKNYRTKVNNVLKQHDVTF